MARHNMIRGCSRVLSEGAQRLAAQTGIAAGLFRYEESSYVYWLGGCERCGFLDVDAIDLMRSMGEKNAEAEMAARVQVLLERLEHMCYGRCDHFVSFLGQLRHRPKGQPQVSAQPRVITRAEGALSPFDSAGQLRPGVLLQCLKQSTTVEGVWLVPDLTLEDVAKELGVTVDRIRAALTAAGLTQSEQATFVDTALERERRERERRPAVEQAAPASGPAAMVDSYCKLAQGVVGGIMAGTRPGLTANTTVQEVPGVRAQVYRAAWEAELRGLEEAQGRPLTESERALALAHFGLAQNQYTVREPLTAAQRARLAKRVHEQYRSREADKVALDGLEEVSVSLAGAPREMDFVHRRDTWAWSPHSDLPEPDDNPCRQVAEETGRQADKHRAACAEVVDRAQTTSMAAVRPVGEPLVGLSSATQTATTTTRPPQMMRPAAAVPGRRGAQADVIIIDDPVCPPPEALGNWVALAMEKCGRRAEPTGLVRALLEASEQVLPDGAPLGLAQAQRNLAWLLGKGFTLEKIDGARLARLGRAIK